MALTPLLASINYLDVIQKGSVVELAVLALLVAVSAISWATIGLKQMQLSRARAQSLTFLDTFWKGSRLDAIYQSARSLEGSPLSKVFCAGYEELSKLAKTNEGQDGAMSERLGGIENVESRSGIRVAGVTEVRAYCSFTVVVSGKRAAVLVL